MSFTPDDIATFLEQWRSTGLMPLVVIGWFMVATVLFVPILVSFLVSAYLLPPFQCAVASLVGIVTSAFIGFALGRFGGNTILAKVPKKIISTIRSKMSQHEVLSVAVIRKIPIAPFLVVNMVLGAIGTPAVSFGVGTALGMTPAVILVSIFDQSYESAMADPSPRTIALIVFLTISALTAAYFAPAIAARFKRAPWLPQAKRK